MKYLFIIAIFFSFTASAQDTTTSTYVQVPKAFVTKYKAYTVYRDNCNRQFNAVQGNDSLYYTSANAIKEFEAELSEAGVTKANIISRIVRKTTSFFQKPVSIIIQPSGGTITKTQ